MPAAKVIALEEKKQAVAIRGKDKTKTETDNIYSTALFYYFKENYKKALPFFKKHLHSYPDSAKAWIYAGVCYGKSSRYQEEIEAYKQAIRLKPDDANAHFGLGTTYFKLGSYQEAIQALKHAIRLKPDDAEAHYNLGLTYLLINDSGSALEEYKILKILMQKGQTNYLISPISRVKNILSKLYCFEYA